MVQLRKLLPSTLLAFLAMGMVGSLSGCGKQSKEAIKPDTFAPAPKSDSPAGSGPSKPSESAEG